MWANTLAMAGDHVLLGIGKGNFVEFVPVCPEVECGLGIPRESMHLEGSPDSPRLITTRTKVDHTERMTTWARKRVQELEQEELCGFILE